MRFLRFEKIINLVRGKYLRYAVGEIILVVIGILLALQVNNLNEKRKLRAQAQRATLQTNIDNAVNNRITNYTTNALTAEDNELSRVNAFIKAKQERADQQVRTANNLAMMSELADNFNVSPQGVTYIPGSDYIFYPGNMNTGQQYLYSAASPTTTD